MLENIIAFCGFEGPKYLIFSENIPPLIYYSHLPIIFISFFVGLYVLIKAPKLLPNRILFLITTLFSLWVFSDSIFWASNRSDVIMFVWSLTILLEPLIYACAFYLIHTVTDNIDMPFYKKLIAVLLCLPTIILLSTKYTLPGFDIDSCLSTEGFIGYYDYFVEAVFILWIVMYASLRYKRKTVTEEKKQILYLTFGIIVFLLAFSSGNIIGSLTENWNVAQAGLFGMPIFIAFLAYSIVKLKTFDIKLIGTQALVFGIGFLLFAVLFITNIHYVQIVVVATLVLFIIMGTMLVRSVRREIESRELIEKQKTLLESANSRLKVLDKQKTEFVSLASHQLRAPMTAIKGYSALILDGDYGTVPDQLKEPLQHILTSTQFLIQIVTDFLDVTRIELGTMKFTFDNFDLKDLVKDVVGELAPNISISGIEFKYDIPDESMPFYGDATKIRQVVNNLIDNAIKYTKHGSVHVTLSKSGSKYRFAVQDTGVGIDPQTLPRLFEKFIRAGNANDANVIGTGLGLYVAKQMVEKHNGKIWAESDGEGKGSTFIVEIEGVK